MENKEETKMEEPLKHLVFRLGKEMYATPLLHIKEITKLQQIKTVPFMVPYFRGILNLRGQIVSVIDLRLKFEILQHKQDLDLMIVVETENGVLGAVVDDVVAVTDLYPSQIASQIALKTKVSVEFFRGIGRFGDNLINVIDIAGILSQGDYQLIRRASGQK